MEQQEAGASCASQCMHTQSPSSETSGHERSMQIKLLELETLKLHGRSWRKIQGLVLMFLRLHPLTYYKSQALYPSVLSLIHLATVFFTTHWHKDCSSNSEHFFPLKGVLLIYPSWTELLVCLYMSDWHCGNSFIHLDNPAPELFSDVQVLLSLLMFLNRRLFHKCVLLQISCLANSNMCLHLVQNLISF